MPEESVREPDQIRQDTGSQTPPERHERPIQHCPGWPLGRGLDDSNPEHREAAGFGAMPPLRGEGQVTFVAGHTASSVVHTGFAEQGVPRERPTTLRL